jgi:DNA topoisomerase VI subunit A
MPNVAQIPEQCRLKMTAGDIKTGKDMLKEDFIMKNSKWHEELQLMIKRKEKAEIRECLPYVRALLDRAANP